MIKFYITYNKRKYLHYIIMCWFILTKKMIKKRSQIKILYENMLNTYVNMADDMFGNNQIENPSVQDAMSYYSKKNFQRKEMTKKSYYITKEEIYESDYKVEKRKGDEFSETNKFPEKRESKRYHRKIKQYNEEDKEE